MGVVLAPILEGKVEVWKSWMKEMNGSRTREFAEFNSRYGLTRHAAWLVETPSGPAVIALHQGPGGDEFMVRSWQLRTMSSTLRSGIRSKRFTVWT